MRAFIDTADAQPKSVLRTYVGWRGPTAALFDATAWFIALTIGTLERFDFRVDLIDARKLALFAVGAATTQVVVGSFAGLYVGRWRIGSREEAGAIVADVVLMTALLFSIDRLPRIRPVPLSSVIAGGFCALVLMGGTRFALREAIDYRRRPSSKTAIRLIVFGAGEGGTQAVNAMLCDRHSPYVPVALLDDALSKRALHMRGLRVEGGRDDLAEVAKRHQAEALLIAIPSADTNTIAELTELGRSLGLAVKILPPVGELFGTDVDVVDIRDVHEHDLLGRGVVDTDVMSVAGYLTGKRVLVTGAGGSIGSELCRQIARFEPSDLCMVDRDESRLHGVQLSLEGRALLDSPNVVLLDIRDRENVFELFRERRPQVVFHAAAVKHLPLLEHHPGAAVQVNVSGSRHVLAAAAEVGVDYFVNISTDKAADPISVLGATKRIAERMTAYVAGEATGTFLSVRFGNVLGSSGSVLTTFRAQAAGGGPITVTDADVTRYFMTVTEAVELVIQAGVIGRSGEVLVLDMGEPVRIADVAQRFVERAAQPIEIVFTGLRKGEKLHEVLFATGEVDERPFHPLISHVPVAPLDPELAELLDCRLPTAECRAAVMALSDTTSSLAEVARPREVGPRVM
jgi:FlaA1/EpsC-like NDP-sugar epimerase